MLINFCDPRLQPRISCDKINHDGYPVENLVSAEFGKRRLGFLAEYFIKPPVTITLSFPTNIDIYEIYINPVVGSQKSSGFEIYTFSEKVRDSWLLESRKSQQSNVSSGAQIFLPVGRGNVGEPGTICFHNRSYVINHADKCSDPPPYSYLFELRHHKPIALNFVSHLRIRVTRTAAGKSVALKSIDVWGRPARLAFAEQVHRIYDLLKSQCKPEPSAQIEVNKAEPSEDLIQNSSQKSSNKNIENGVEIPDDFLDSLTFEIMSIPMLLPCGKNIDQSTLDKLIDSEASRGRLPSDPFTGVLFDGSNRPLPNVGLKIRLDKFVLANSEALSHVPRSVGRKTLYCSDDKPSTSCLLEEMTKAQSIDEIISERPMRRHKKKQHHGTLKDSFVCTVGASTTEGGSVKRRKISETSVVKNASAIKGEQVGPLSKVTHEDSLQKSLDSALFDTLSSLPSFIVQKTNDSIAEEDTEVARSRNACIKCGTGETLYRAPCAHVFCRKCLTASDYSSNGNTINDEMCHRIWKRSEFVRVH